MQEKYPATDEFNRRYNGLLKLTGDHNYDQFVEQTVASLIRFKQVGSNENTGNVALQKGLPERLDARVPTV